MECVTGRCYRCLRPRSRCYCARIAPLETRTRFALCIHPDEYRHQKCGTGRLCRIALPQSELFVGVGFDGNDRLNALLGDPRLSPWLLYPGPDAIDLSSGSPFLLPPGRELLVVILDGTWRQARKILHVSRNLRGLPRLAFTPSFRSRFTIKRQPHPNCLSTIEAVHELLGALETSGYEHLDRAQDSLLDILADLVDWQASHQIPGRARRSLAAAEANPANPS